MKAWEVAGCSVEPFLDLEPKVILGGTVFTGWDIVLILLLYVGLPLLVLITLIVGVVMFVRRARR